MATFTEKVIFQEDVIFAKGRTPDLARTSLKQEQLASYMVPWTAWRVHDALQTNLPGTAATDDLALIGGTYGTAVPIIQTSDGKAASIQQYARAQIELPPEYDAGQTVQLRFSAGMVTTISDTSAALGVEAFLSDNEGAVSGVDLCSTGATTINNLVFANKDFTITATSLVPGSILDVRINIAIVDSATATAVLGTIGRVALLCDIRG